MSEQSRCPECGSELPSGTLGGLCPKCLLAAGFESRGDQEQSADGGSAAPTTPHSGGFVPPQPADLAAHFPQLEIIELVGYGGMGAVYKARQRNLDRLVALKIIRPESASAPAFAERFNREARTLARLNHPHIVAVYDFGEVSVSDVAVGGPSRTLYFFLMEYVDGANLRQLMQAGDLTPPQALAIVPQICDALQFAHDEGIVHRDIKPENILLDKRGRVKIADFGLAKLVGRSPEEFTLTGTHQVMGTPRYMAPEQMEGSHAVDHRADIFSLGVVFYEMLTGEVPAGHFEPPSKKVEIDVRLDEVVLRALAREPERRYQQAIDVKTDVERCTAEQIAQSPPVPGQLAGVPEDFVLMNPRLPRTAQWITVYSIVARPAMWLLVTLIGFLSSEWAPAEGDLETSFTQFASGRYSLLDVFFIVVVAIGGFKLRALVRSGPRWIKVGVALHIGLAAIELVLWLTLVPMGINILREQARTNPEHVIAQGFTQQQVDELLANNQRRLEIPDVVDAFLSVLLMVLDIAVLVWLWRNSRYLPLSDTKVLPVSPLVKAAAAEPISDKKRGTLGQAWNEWWAERDRWVTLAAQNVLGLIFALCLIAYLSFWTKSDFLPGEDGQRLRHTIVEHGLPFSPWFRFEMNPPGELGWKWAINWISWSSAIMLFGFAAWCTNWQIEKAKAKASGKQLRWWHGSPNFAIAIWGAGTLFAIVLAFVIGGLPAYLDRHPRNGDAGQDEVRDAAWSIPFISSAVESSAAARRPPAL